MQYRQLGKNGPKISLVGLGCNNFGGRMDFDATKTVIHAALDAGITFIDTAASYGELAASEQYIGRVLGPRRKDVVLATKFGNTIKGSGEKERPRVTRAYVVSACEDSLKRLQTDWIDLYQLHYPDAKTPIEETLRGLDDLMKAGKVRHVGCSNFDGAMVEGAEAASAKNQLPHFISVQNEYSPLEREAETDVVPAMTKYGLGLLPYAPLAGGLLSGKYKQGAPLPQGARLTVGGGSRFLTDANLGVVEKLRAYAEARGQSLLNLTFGWLAAHPWVSCVMAGATTPAQIQQNVAAVSWIPSPKEVEEINNLLPN